MKMLICDSSGSAAGAGCEHRQGVVQVVGEKMGKAIRNAEMEKIPVVCVIGPRDIEAGVVSVRTYADGELGELPHQELVTRLSDTNKNRTQF